MFIDTHLFLVSHAKRPRGFGSWAFGIGTKLPPINEVFWVHAAKYSDAKAAAITEGKRRRVYFISVLP